MLYSTLEVRLARGVDFAYPRGFDWTLSVTSDDRDERVVKRSGWQASERRAYRAAARELKKVRKGFALARP